MSSLNIHKALMDAVEAVVADMVVPEIVENTPRDLKKYPIKNINRKDGKRPKRQKVGAHKWVVRANGNYYNAVTGELKKSISYERKFDRVSVGVLGEWPASNYAHFQEFGTRYMAPRFFVRNSVYWPGKHAQILRQIQKKFNQNLWR